MDNYQIADSFSLLSKLSDIHGENSFKAKSYAIAAFNIEKLPEQLINIPKEAIYDLKGIGASTGKKIIEILETGRLSSLDEIIARTPPGIIEMLQIKGIGPKKIATIWKEMEIESLGELLYACQENRLKLYKGFGEKTQISVQENIEFYFRNQGIFLFAQVEAVFLPIKAYLEKIFLPENVAVTGAYRRKEITIDVLEFVVNEQNSIIKEKMITANPPELMDEQKDFLVYQLKNGLRLKFYTGIGNISRRIFNTTGNDSFLQAFHSNYPDIQLSNENEISDDVFFTKAGIQYIEPCLRETAGILGQAASHSIKTLIQQDDIKGIIHSHSNWSDGTNTIEEMALAAKTKGLEYLVISDHSKSAFYANGLSEERIKAQHLQIDELNQQLAPFKVFKSIECDILNDGSLDYSHAILSTFEMVIVSIHSNLKMTEEKAMQRLLTAIENPYTTILGHMTGRLLLSRKGYPVDHRKIIDACAANGVIIELNAHPSRLDIDWNHIAYALEKNVLISIDPDAHAIEGFDDTRYGVFAAQKAGVGKQNNFSSFSLSEMENYLMKRKKIN